MVDLTFVDWRMVDFVVGKKEVVPSLGEVEERCTFFFPRKNMIFF